MFYSPNSLPKTDPDFTIRLYIQGMSDAANRLSWIIYFAVPTQPPKGKKTDGSQESLVLFLQREQWGFIVLFVFLLRRINKYRTKAVAGSLAGFL